MDYEETRRNRQRRATQRRLRRVAKAEALGSDAPAAYRRAAIAAAGWDEDNPESPEAAYAQWGGLATKYGREALSRSLGSEHWSTMDAEADGRQAGLVALPRAVAGFRKSTGLDPIPNPRIPGGGLTDEVRAKFATYLRRTVATEVLDLVAASRDVCSASREVLRQTDGPLGLRSAMLYDRADTRHEVETHASALESLRLAEAAALGAELREEPSSIFDALAEVLETLSPNERRAVELFVEHEVDGRPLAELADHYEMSREGIRKASARGREILLKSGQPLFN